MKKPFSKKRVMTLIIEGLFIIFAGRVLWGHWSAYRANEAAVNQMFSPVIVTATTGDTAELPLQAGKPHAYFFWASWCTPCTAELALLLASWDDFADTPLYFVAIDDDLSIIKSTEKERDYPFQSYWDRGFSAFQKLPVPATPAVVYVDAAGKVVDIDTGVNPLLVKKLKSHFGN